MKELLLIPGPTPINHEVLNELSKDVVSHVSEEFVSTTLEALKNLKPLFGTEKGSVFIVPGSGTIGMEIAIKNLVGEDERILVISHGYFGERFVEILDEHGIERDVLRSKWGEVVSLESLKERIRTNKYAAITITHVDTSTGTLSPVKEYARVIKEISPDTLIILDGVCATGGVPEEMDEWGIDFILTGSQKALSTPPGLSIFAVSERGLKKRESLKKIGFYYGDILRWKRIMDNPKAYFATPSVNLIFALNMSLKRILSEGLSNRFKRHVENGEFIRKKIENLGFKVFGDEKSRAPTLTVFLYPEGVEDETFRKRLKEKGVVVASCIGDLKGKGFRMGHMGEVGRDELLFAFEKIKEVLKEC